MEYIFSWNTYSDRIRIRIERIFKRVAYSDKIHIQMATYSFYMHILFDLPLVSKLTRPGPIIFYVAPSIL